MNEAFIKEEYFGKEENVEIESNLKESGFVGKINGIEMLFDTEEEYYEMLREEK